MPHAGSPFRGTPWPAVACPTGIDVRNGLQNECVGCAAFIDACDEVMDRWRYPRGLVRYATANGVAQGLTRAQKLRRAWRPRVLINGTLLAVDASAFGMGLALREKSTFIVPR